ncbi:MAG: SHOCT domain-containing protein [Clostridiales bacterium]|nr:SHOCT domain-containing protein [Clostridiales bacterium]
MGFFNFNFVGHDEFDVGAKNNEGRLYRYVQLAGICVIIISAAILMFSTFRLIKLNSTGYGIVFSICIVGFTALAALPWVRVIERVKDKKFFIIAIVFLAIIGLCAVLWITCVWQIISIFNNVVYGEAEAVEQSVINSLNVIRASLIVSLQFGMVSNIVMNYIKYRKTLLPYQIMSGVSSFYIDFYISLLLTAFTITPHGMESVPYALHIISNGWVAAFFGIAVVTLSLSGIVFWRTDRRRLIITANTALENSGKTKDDSGAADGEKRSDDATGESALERMKKLRALLDEGLITQEEYDAKRNDILNSI